MSAGPRTARRAWLASARIKPKTETPSSSDAKPRPAGSQAASLRLDRRRRLRRHAGMSSDPRLTHAPPADVPPEPLPGVACLAVHPERLEQMWQLTPAQRLGAARRGKLTLGEMLRWAARAPDEVPLVNGEFFFISLLSADVDDGN
jgi:hypothetical protein